MWNTVEAQVVDIRMRVELRGSVNLEYVDFAENVLLRAPVRGVVEQVQDALAKARPREVGGHGLPGATEVVLGFKKGLVAVAVGITG